MVFLINNKSISGNIISCGWSSCYRITVIQLREPCSLITYYKLLNVSISVYFLILGVSILRALILDTNQYADAALPI